MKKKAAIMWKAARMTSSSSKSGDKSGDGKSGDRRDVPVDACGWSVVGWITSRLSPGLPVTWFLEAWDSSARWSQQSLVAVLIIQHRRNRRRVDVSVIFASELPNSR
jgi:hypothetical protein